MANLSGVVQQLKKAQAEACISGERKMHKAIVVRQSQGAVDLGSPIFDVGMTCHGSSAPCTKAFTKRHSASFFGEYPMVTKGIGRRRDTTRSETSLGMKVTGGTLLIP